MWSIWKRLSSAAILASTMAWLTVPANADVRKDPPASVHGAVYVPSNAHNVAQLWKNFSLEETKRDFGYARKIHVNVFRICASYEFWKANPEKFQSEFDQMLGVAHDTNIRILISLFENDGVPPTEENMWTTYPKKAFDIQSPGREIATGDKSGWEAPRGFVQ